MNDMDTSFEQQETGKTGFPNRALIGTAGLLALISASCCVLPIGLSILGLGGTWLLLLGPFVAYRAPIVVAVGLVFDMGLVACLFQMGLRVGPTLHGRYSDCNNRLLHLGRDSSFMGS